MKLVIVYGTRPEIIKLAPIVKECGKRSIEFFCVHTGQHHSYEMDRIFFEELDLPLPHYRLDIGQMKLQGHGAQTGVMLTEIENILLREKPDVVMVLGDTNSVLAGALAAAKLPSTDDKKIEVAHVEAGLRSHDLRMPEEINRIIVDHISDMLFVPTKTERDILLREGMSRRNVFVVGNTIVDSLLQARKSAAKNSTILKRLGLTGRYILLTLHRQENVDSGTTLAEIARGLKAIVDKTKLPIIFPVHPRTEGNLKEFKIELPKEVKMIKPVGYLDFISLESNAELIMTDSGGVQEEACILQVPCITIRENTERPATVAVGANLVSGTTAKGICENTMSMIKKRSRNWKNPFGDGNTAKRIMDTIVQQHEK